MYTLLTHRSVRTTKLLKNLRNVNNLYEDRGYTSLYPHWQYTIWHLIGSP